MSFESKKNANANAARDFKRLVKEFMHCKPIPVMKTGFSLCTFSNREKPVLITSQWPYGLKNHSLHY